jgi:hypothetical protein
VLAKLLALDEAVAALKVEADEIERGIEDRRARLWGNVRRADDNPRLLEAELERFLADQKVRRSGCRPSSPPPSAVLGVRVAEKVTRAARCRSRRLSAG